MTTESTSLDVFDMSTNEGPYTILGKGDDCYLKYFPNLSTLNLSYACVYEWSFFNYYNTTAGKALIASHKGSSPLQSVTLASSSTPNKNHNLASIKDIFVGIAATYSSEVGSGQKIYIGSQSSATATNLLSAWGSTTTYSVTTLTEYNAFSPYIFDLGVKVNGTYAFEMTTDKVVENDEIILPTTTYEEAFGTAYDKDSFETRDFSINWKVYEISAFGGLPTAISVTGGSYTVKASTSMLVIVGTIGGDIVDATPKSYLYTFLANDNTNTSLFGKFKDRALRLYLFSTNTTAAATEVAITSLDAVTTAIQSKFSLNSIANFSNSAVSTNSVSLNSLAITSLAGMESYTELISLTVKDQALSNISAISSMTKLVSVDLSNNLISDATPFSGLNLVTLILKNNKLKSLSELKEKIVLATLQTLDVSFNPAISADDLSYLKQSKSPLTNLNVYSTGASFCLAGVTKLSQMMTDSGLSKLNLNLNNETAAEVTLATLNSFISATNSFSLPATLVSGSYVDNSLTYNYTLNNLYIDNYTCLGNGNNVKVLFEMSGVPQLSGILIEKPYVRNNATQYLIETATANLNISDLDSALYAALVANGYLTLNSNNNYAVDTSKTELNISSNYGITSLKNLNLFGYATINISQNPISELWTGAFSNLKSFTLSDATIDATKVYDALSGSPQLNTVNLLKSFGIDYADISETQSVYIVSEQTYNFVIPGIYRCGNKVTDQFKDANFYELLLDSYENYDNTYLYADGVKEQIAFLDLSALSSQDLVDITGIEYFSNTLSIDLHNVNVLTLAPFAAVDENNKLVTLNLSSCNLNDEKVANYLSALHSLTSLDISSNNLTTFNFNGEAIFYRRLATLDASSQQALRSLDGLEKVFELRTLDVSNNKIDEFSNLIKMQNVSSVSLFGNATLVTNECAFLYGTSGKVNTPIFVDLINKGVTIFANSSNTSEALTVNSNLISTAEMYVSFDLNAIVIPQQHNGEIQLPTAISGATTTAIAYILKSDFSIDDAFATLLVPSFEGLVGSQDVYSYSTETQTLRVILKEIKTISSVPTTVYREFIINYVA